MRRSEPLAGSFVELVDRTVGAVRPRLGEPFALFGHSLGALVAFEVARRLEARGMQPAMLFVSGTSAPSRRERQRYARLESDEALLAELERLQGTPPWVLANAELMELVLPVLRADFRVVAHYESAPGSVISAPVQVFSGLSDEPSAGALDAWRTHTRARCDIELLPGGHFFIHEREAEILQRVVSCLTERLKEAEPVKHVGRGELEQGSAHHSASRAPGIFGNAGVETESWNL
jgi:surfactin synthase thioesterase subunit